MHSNLDAYNMFDTMEVEFETIACKHMAVAKSEWMDNSYSFAHKKLSSFINMIIKVMVFV